MLFTLVVAGITGLGVCASVIFKPEIAIGKIRIGTYWIVSLAGAVVLLAFGAVSPADVACKFTENTAVNPLKILLLFFTMTFLSVFLDEIGVFEYLADKVVEKCGDSQIALFIKLYVTVSILTVFTSNDVIILTFTPFICAFTRRAGINPLPYLFGEFFAANTWSMCLVIGNPTNVYLATGAGITFWGYLKVMALPTLAAGVVSAAVLILLFRINLADKMTPIPTEKPVLDKFLTIVGTVHLGLCIVALAVSSYVGAEMCYVSAIAAISLTAFALVYRLAVKRGKGVLAKTVKRLPYELLPFLLSMFVIVLALGNCGATEKFAEILATVSPVFSVGISGFLVSNVINNIPMSVLYGSILSFPSLAGCSGSVYAAIVGSNIGAYFTPVGALAGIMWLSILNKENVKVSFGKFCLYGALCSVPTLLAALGVLFLTV